MNDRYLYRAKRIDNGEWITGYLLVKKKDFYICEKPYECMDEYSSLNGQSYGFGGFKWVDSSTICQCTGREGEWEHDIFQYDDERYEIQFCEYSLTWEAVSIFSSESIRLGEFSPSEYVRIGNLIDNPELLEMGE